MKSDTRTGVIEEQLKQDGFKGAVVSTGHLSELRSEYERLLDDGSLDRTFYDEIVERYGLAWDFDPSTRLPAARSIIITAAQQPKMSMEFTYGSKKYYGIIPPTYVYDTDEVILGIISKYVHRSGYSISQALLPAKLLAVRSGLARYGRNNIAYIDGWGSYFRLRVYFSDMPCGEESWREATAMEQCNECTACVKKCPTKAISSERFLVDAGRCLTFFNEGVDEFPEWIDPTWHNCLIGCMICQDVCPANKEHIRWLMPGGEFSEEETKLILDGIAQDRLPAQTTKKLSKVSMLDSYDLLQRNLRVLIEKAGSGKQ